MKEEQPVASCGLAAGADDVGRDRVVSRDMQAMAIGIEEAIREEHMRARIGHRVQEPVMQDVRVIELRGSLIATGGDQEQEGSNRGEAAHARISRFIARCRNTP